MSTQVCCLYILQLARYPTDSHVDIKLDNVLVNYGKGDLRFTDVQLGDCGNTVPDNSPWARDCDVIGAPIWRSPEAMLQIGWGTPTDIWSFGAMVSPNHGYPQRPVN